MIVFWVVPDPNFGPLVSSDDVDLLLQLSLHLLIFFPNLCKVLPECEHFPFCGTFLLLEFTELRREDLYVLLKSSRIVADLARPNSECIPRSPKSYAPKSKDKGYPLVEFQCDVKNGFKLDRSIGLDLDTPIGLTCS